MENPWRKIRSDSPLILEGDLESINRHNASRRNGLTRVNTDLVPEPFIGNSDSARLVLLNLNPGDAEEDKRAHRHPEFRAAMLRNLFREPQSYAFYPLNPTFAWTPCAKWWAARTRELQDATGLDRQTFADRLLVIEWFPYHSRKSGLSVNPVCESQRYSFHLAKEMLEHKKLVVRMRSRKHWAVADPVFGRVDALKNPQCGYITKGNTVGDLFDRMVEALR